MGRRLVAALGALGAMAWLLARLAPSGWPSSASEVPGWLGDAPVAERVVSLAFVAAYGCVAWLAFVLVAVSVGAFPRGAVRDAAERVLGVAVVGVAAGALVAGPAAADGPFDRPAGPARGAPPAAGQATPPASPPPASPAPPPGATAPAVPPPLVPPPAVPPPARPPSLPDERGGPQAGQPARAATRGLPAAPPPAPAAAEPRGTPAAGEPVVVAPGDTLWGIAARRLGAAASPALTAATWPRWYAANRPLIGPDPGRIRPGQRLVPPSDGGQP